MLCPCLQCWKKDPQIKYVAQPDPDPPPSQPMLPLTAQDGKDDGRNSCDNDSGNNSNSNSNSSQLDMVAPNGQRTEHEMRDTQDFIMTEPAIA